jgi:hypothetical protein
MLDMAQVVSHHLSQRRPGLDHVGFMVDKVALGQVSIHILWFSHQCHSTVALHTHISSADEQQAHWLQFRDIVSLHRHKREHTAHLLKWFLHVQYIPYGMSEVPV